MGSWPRAVRRACALLIVASLAGFARADEGPFPPHTGAVPQAAPDHPFARNRTISPPDCVDASSMVTDHGPGVAGATYMRVENIGDPGTDELAHELARTVTWPVSYYTGLEADSSAQRGYADRFGHSGFQLDCSRAGIFINTGTFSHAAPLSGEGPNASVGRDFDPGFAVFADASSLLVEADVRVPTLFGSPAPLADGTVQVAIYIYYHDRTTVTAIAQLVMLLDNREPGTNGAGVEVIGNDGHTPFISGPLARTDALGFPVRFATPMLDTATMQFGHGWAESRHVAVAISPSNLAAALTALRDTGAAISANPADYDVTAFGVLVEAFPGTTTAHEVAVGASVSGLALRAIPLRGLVRP